MGEPYRLTPCSPSGGPVAGKLFTCARPGRFTCGATKPVPDDVVDTWVRGLPKGDPLVIVSLLGRKPPPESTSEFSFYSFRGGFDQPADRPGCPTFQAWLDRRFGDGRFLVLEYPTIDLKRLPSDVASRAADAVIQLLNQGRTVVVMDSGGVSRTGELCRFMGFECRAQHGQDC